jgi:L-ascorbate metabolism protein UlaG (beta-lactamase superfamily)
MKLTKYAQSCVLIETKNKRILIDPGYIAWNESLLKEHWTNIDLILVTHRHGDHCHADSIKILQDQGAKFFTSKEVADVLPELNPEIVEDGKILNSGDIKVEIVKAVHGYTPLLKDGKEIKENIGIIIDDGIRRVYMVGDSICFPNEYKCNVIFVPVCNHGLVMGPYEAALFAKETGAELAIPYHYDNPTYPVDLQKVEEEFKKQKMNCKLLKMGESIEV